MQEVGIRAGMLVNAGSLCFQMGMSLFKLIPVQKVSVTSLVIFSIQY